ncbi:MAG: hypothetical protein ACI4XM_01325 [Candidatus Coprovivens sp.]
MDDDKLQLIKDIFVNYPYTSILASVGIASGVLFTILLGAVGYSMDSNNKNLIKENDIYEN